jgi:hypothetical protein
MVNGSGGFDREYKLYIYADLEFRFDVESWTFNTRFPSTLTHCSQARTTRHLPSEQPTVPSSGVADSP